MFVPALVQVGFAALGGEAERFFEPLARHAPFEDPVELFRVDVEGGFFGGAGGGEGRVGGGGLLLVGLLGWRRCGLLLLVLLGGKRGVLGRELLLLLWGWGGHGLLRRETAADDDAVGLWRWSAGVVEEDGLAGVEVGAVGVGEVGGHAPLGWETAGCVLLDLGGEGGHLRGVGWRGAGGSVGFDGVDICHGGGGAR